MGRQSAVHMRTDLPLDALETALWRQKPRRTSASFIQVERAVLQWVAWYGGERLHSAMGYVPPGEYEQAYRASLEAAPRTA
ncbi:hypothetical protein [Streptomyces sp. NPDC050388]|uniref:hypothetical protein n=1 Tax=Streptomyces sp. NPDC050388 TaxID=3155781 RepID=UPI00341D5F4A